MNNRRGDDLRSIGGFVARGRTCLAKLSGVSSTTSGRPTAAPPIARAGRVASPAIASPEAAASPARRLTATSPFGHVGLRLGARGDRGARQPGRRDAVVGPSSRGSRRVWRRVRTWTRRRCSSSTAGQCTPVSINGPPRPCCEEEAPKPRNVDNSNSRDLNRPAPQWIIPLEIANYGPITVHRQSTHTVHAPLAISSQFSIHGC